MNQCLNPECLYQNKGDTKFCPRCGSKVLLGSRYRPIEIIGEGGFGRTFHAIDEYKPSKPPCVIKQFYPQPHNVSMGEKAVELFEQEAVRLESLGQHPQIPELLAYLVENGRQYLVQEFIDGENLQQELQWGFFTERQIRKLLADLLPVLQFCHEQQVIHRDIKPENIIRRRSDRKLILVDFGAAKYATHKALAVTGTIVGSAGYAAPEQSVGKASFTSDIYSLGVTCIHLMTKISPFELFDVDEGEWVWRKHLKAPVSNELSEILDKMLQFGTKKRYQSAKEVLSALNPAPVAIARVATPVSVPSLVQVSSAVSVPSRRYGVPLNSEVGADYTKLQNYLAAGKWYEADKETRNLALWIMRCEDRGYLVAEDWLQFPRTDLCTIDQLWVKYSKGRFGFSVQKRLWESVGGNPHADWATVCRFGDRVGWRQQGQWFNQKEILFELRAPEGHLPWRVISHGVSWFMWGVFWVVFRSMYARAKNCKL